MLLLSSSFRVKAKFPLLRSFTTTSIPCARILYQGWALSTGTHPKDYWEKNMAQYNTLVVRRSSRAFRLILIAKELQYTNFIRRFGWENVFFLSKTVICFHEIQIDRKLVMAFSSSFQLSWCKDALADIKQHPLRKSSYRM
jgi:hypothetical protein